jgi:hypothetical protein
MEIVHARCCGLDVPKKSVVACVLISQPDGLIERQVRALAGPLRADWPRVPRCCEPVRGGTDGRLQRLGCALFS